MKTDFKNNDNLSSATCFIFIFNISGHSFKTESEVRVCHDAWFIRLISELLLLLWGKYFMRLSVI